MLHVPRRLLNVLAVLAPATMCLGVQPPTQGTLQEDPLVTSDSDEASLQESRWKRLAQAAQDVRQNMQDAGLTEETILDQLTTLLKATELYLETYPEDLKALNLKASLCGELRNDTCVDNTALDMLQIQPENIQTGLQWAAYYASTDRNQRALEIVDILLKSKPEGLMYLNAWIITAREIDPSLIDARFQELIATPETLPQALAFITARRQSDVWHAMELNDLLFAMHPDDPEVMKNRGHSLRAANRFADAREVLGKLPEEHLADPKIAYLYSDCHYADHEFDRAHEIMSSIDLDSIDSASGLQRRLTFMLPLRKQAAESWPTELDRRVVDAAEDTNPKVRLMIDGQPVEVELFLDEAPNTVAAFLAMTSRGLYDDTPFGQVQTGFRSIGGTLPIGVPYSLPTERALPGSRDFYSGTLAMYLPMASNENSAGCEWCIYHFPAPHLNQERTVFGRVTDGLETVRSMREDSHLDAVEIIRSPDVDVDPIVIDATGNRRPFSEVMEQFTLPVLEPDPDRNTSEE